MLFALRCIPQRSSEICVQIHYAVLEVEEMVFETGTNMCRFVLRVYSF